MATKTQLAHARRKWDAELRRFDLLFGQYYQMEQMLHLQRERIHNAYEAYKKLGGK